MADWNYNDYLANAKKSWQQSWQPERESDVKVADTQIDAEEQSNLADRNEATAARQNQNALMPRQNARAGGSRYTRRGMWTPGGSGLTAANAAAKTAARKKAAYAQIEQKYEDRWQGKLNTPQTTTVTPNVFSVYY